MKRLIIGIILSILVLPGCQEKITKQSDYLQLTSRMNLDRSDPDRRLEVIDSLHEAGSLTEPMADLLRARIYDAQGQRRVSEHYFERAYEQWSFPPEDWEGYLTAAYCLSALRMLRSDPEGALAVAMDALEKESSYKGGQPLLRSCLLHTMSQCQFALQRPEMVQTELESLRILQQLPQDHSTRVNIIISLRTLFDLYFSRGDCENAYVWLGRWEDAMREYDLSPEPDFEREYRGALLLDRVRLLEKTGRSRDAANLFASIPPEDLLFEFTIDETADYLMSAGRFGEAAEWLARADEIGSGDDGARMNFDNITNRLAPRYFAALKAGHTQEALNIGTQICEALDSALVWERQNRASELAIIYETTEKEELMHKKQAQVAILSNIIFSLVLLLLAGFVALRVATVSKKQLSEKNQDLYKTLQLLTAREEAELETLQRAPEEHLNPRQKLYRRICTLMQEKMPYTDSKLKRTDLAKMLATNYNNVADAIRECSDGQTLSEFLDGFRLKHAARMLADLDEPIGLISEMSGFQSRGHFNTLFREKYKMTPSEYRKAVQESGIV